MSATRLRAPARIWMAAGVGLLHGMALAAVSWGRLAFMLDWAATDQGPVLTNGVLLGLAAVHAASAVATLVGSNLGRRLLLFTSVLLLPVGGLSIIVVVTLMTEPALLYTSAEYRWQRGETWCRW